MEPSAGTTSLLKIDVWWLFELAYYNVLRNIRLIHILGTHKHVHTDSPGLECHTHRKFITATYTLSLMEKLSFQFGGHFTSGKYSCWSVVCISAVNFPCCWKL